ncbi:VOC family protein [Rhodopirellula sp. MGV]|uniref:VOC family protein n=1 Tax=Rhodopirellula sp. MGV TaxID=2023130 RepID=UPI000B9766F0|nr:VOC family protein [Rhodopirellula sp. MGV]OYP34169.1 lactoylglutathione lyase [Rhodopirellula sp. MGV]PNY33604.1 VOC family protein [Rhodopirellula baltica]
MAPNPVCWFEIYVNDMDRATAFYEAVLATKLETLDSPMPELKMKTFPMAMGSPGAAGALCQMQGVEAGGSGTMIYFACKDCGVEASRVEAAGGKIHKPKTSIGPYGFIAIAVDSEGNMFGLHNPPDSAEAC